MLGTMEKASQVLDLFSREYPEWGAAQVARALGIPKSTAHLLLSSLAQMGLLHRVVTGRYRLGFRILTLSQVLMGSTPWRDVALRSLQVLHAQTQQVVSLAVLDGPQLICLERILPPNSPLFTGRAAGPVIPVHASALGKVMLGHRKWEQVRGLVYEASVLSGVTPEMRIYHEETFGPVAPVVIAEDLDDTVRIANDTPLRPVGGRYHRRPRHRPGCGRAHRIRHRPCQRPDRP